MGRLELRGLTKRLGDRTVVDDVSLDVADGEFLVLLGSSGCGKTTLLRLVCGLERPDAGEIVLAGRSIAGLPPRERQLGMVFQEYGLYPAMDVRGNIAYGLEARGGLSRTEIAERVTDAANRLGLAEVLGSSTQDLSGGEQQRVALARALVKDAHAYLFDEPLSNLDAKLRLRARRDILAVHRMKRQPTLYVTHDQSEAFAMADRIAVMADGRVQQVGRPDQLLDEPANTFVARFVGTPAMNLVPGTVTADRPGADRIGTSFGPVRLTGSRSALLTDGSEVLVGFRPGAIGELGTADRNGTERLCGTVAAVTEGFTETILTVTDTVGGSVVLETADEVELRVGQVVSFIVDAEAVRVFDPVTERALG